MIIRATARNGVTAEDAIAVASDPLVVGPLDEGNPQRQFQIGFDTQARILETVVLVWDNGTEEIIHAIRSTSASSTDQRT